MKMIGAFPSLFLGLSVLAMAQSSSAEPAESEKAWSLHFQLTNVTQWHPPFFALYSGTNSLRNTSEVKASLTSTVFAAFRVWRGAEFHADPEVSGGKGFSNTTGIAGFPNGEIYRVSQPMPKLYLARLYFQQMIRLGDGDEEREDGPDEIAGRIPARRLTLVGGKFSLPDFFDDNSFSQDPRTQFLNWALAAAGAWDYAADTRGYTWGIMTEYAAPNISARLAAVLEPERANGMEMDTHITKAHSLNLELERRYELWAHNGAVRILVFRNTARMGSYSEAVNDPAYDMNIALTDCYGRSKYGFILNCEQSVSDEAGLFARLSWNDGHTETWAYTEIDRSVSLGGVIGGKSWSRSLDKLGIAIVMNGLSRDHEDYLAAGGYGFIIGDGRLRYGLESILETFYSLPLVRFLWLTADYQFVVDPAYNRDRGPVHVLSIRVHAAV